MAWYSVSALPKVDVPGNARGLLRHWGGTWLVWDLGAYELTTIVFLRLLLTLRALYLTLTRPVQTIKAQPDPKAHEKNKPQPDQQAHGLGVQYVIHILQTKDTLPTVLGQ